MIRAIRKVMRGEGIGSAIRRTQERIDEAAQATALRIRGTFAGNAEVPILNVAADGTSLRLGGLQAQLVARLECERALRSVALVSPGVLDVSHPSRHTRRVSAQIETAIRNAIAITGARTIHFEGMHGVPLAEVLRLIDDGFEIIVSVHDFSLFCARPHLIEEPAGAFCFYSQDFDRCHRCLSQTWSLPRNAQRDRRALAREILTASKRVIFPSQFLLDQHRELFALPELAGVVIEPGSAGVPPAVLAQITSGRDARVPRRAIAYAGSAKRHKGAHMLAELAQRSGAALHIFGGGDEDLLRELRRLPNVTVHGYYRGGELPSLLQKHGVGLVVVPSIWPEAHCLVISEAWTAGAAVAAFDLGAPAERIRAHGGGWLAPLDSGADGLESIMNEWLAGSITATPPRDIATPIDAARAHIDLYRTIA
ncbi:MAG TPA: glycosyltransferase [Thermoanaerobaculia bacterium]|nr:glycosyltransferase [Thermoanaerobaculia bacterium]